MSCFRCSSIRQNGPTLEQVYFDPFEQGPMPTKFVCACGQKWWCYNNSPHFWKNCWTTVDDEETWNEIIADGPISIGYPAVAVSVLMKRRKEKQEETPSK